MTYFHSMRRAAMMAPILAVTSIAGWGAAIDVSVTNPNRAGLPGDMITFQGQITNNTDVPVSSTDLFLNFSGFDPVNVMLDQLLGSTNFVIPVAATSPLVDLFTFTLSSATPPGIYPADLVLQTVSGDLSDAQRVTVSVLVPEPGSVGLVGGALLALVWGARRRRANMLLLGAVLAAVAANVAMAQVSAVRFATGAPGLGRLGSTLMVAVPLTNNGSVNASNVQVTGATLRSALLTSPATFPVSLGAVGPTQTSSFQANFDVGALSVNTPYLLTVRGTYQVGGVTGGFAVNRYITIPPASPGSGNVLTATVGPLTVTGAPFPHRPPQFDDKVNAPRPLIPTGPFVAGTKTPNGTGAVPLSPPSLRVRPFAGTVNFVTNASENNPSAGTFCNPGVPPASCAEPSGASNGQGVVFATANWTAAYSTNGGSTWTQLDPTTIFPADAIGFCCDQIVQYVASIDRFIWLLQGSGVRIASASPQQVINSGGTAWTYWNLTPQVLGQPAGTGFDYPDMSVGSNNLYLSWDVGFPSCPAGCKSGFEVVRIPLAQIMAGGTIFFDYTHPEDSSVAWGSHLTQDTGPEIFWAGHDGNSSLRVFSLAEGSNTYFWRNVTISSWPNNTLSSTTPDNQDWLKFGFPGSSVIGATRTSSLVWFAWNAGTNNSFQQPHVQMVALDRSNNFNKTQQVQIWNNDYAFAYPALATDVCTDEVGLSLAYGGNGNYENHVVGIWGDFVVYATTNSNKGVNRYGDYMTIRHNDGTGLFDAFGYGMNTTTGGGMQSDVRYVLFGRPCIIGIR